jgi:hypothetical protein
MLKLYIVGNYFFAINNEGNIFSCHKSKAVIRYDEVDNERFDIYLNGVRLFNAVLYSDITNESNVPYASVSDFLNWFTSNTGQSSSGGGGSASWGAITGSITSQTDLQNQLSLKADLVGGKVPSSQLPAFVDDVLEFANLASFPVTGETGKIYIALDTNLTYRWSGSIYVEISQSLALGETSSTAYRGDRGKSAYDHSQTTGNPHGTQISDISGLVAALGGKVDKPITATVTTTNNAPTQIYQFSGLANGIYQFLIEVDGFETATNSGYAGEFRVKVKVAAGFASLLSVITSGQIVGSNFPGSVQTTAGVSSNNVNIFVTGRNGSTIKWDFRRINK